VNWIDQISSIETYHANDIGRTYVVNGIDHGVFIDSVDHGLGYYSTIGKITKMVYGEWTAHNGKGAYLSWRKHPMDLPEYIELRPDGILGEWHYPRNGPERVGVTYMKNNKKIVRCHFPNGHTLWWSLGVIS